MPLQPMITGARHMIAAGHYLAAEAGHAVLQAGGNVVDAGVAGGIALEIVHSDQVQFSGVAPMVISPRRPRRDRHDRRARRLAASGEARRRSSSEHGGAIPYGVLRTVVPAAPDAWILALERYGTMSFGDVAAAAIRYAREGFTMHPVMAHFIDRYADGLPALARQRGNLAPRRARPARGRAFRAGGSRALDAVHGRRGAGGELARPGRRLARGARRLLPRRPRDRPWCAITTTTAAG